MAVTMSVTEDVFGYYITFSATGTPLPVPGIAVKQSLPIICIAVGNTAAVTTGIFTINDGSGNLVFTSKQTSPNVLAVTSFAAPIRVTGLQIGCSVAAATQGYVIIYKHQPI